RAMHSLDPGVERRLRLGDIAFVAGPRRGAGAQRHRALRKRAVYRVLLRRADAYPFIAESGANARGDHPLQVGVVELEIDPMQQLAAVSYLLDRREIASFVMDARQSIANALLGPV